MSSVFVPFFCMFSYPCSQSTCFMSHVFSFHFSCSHVPCFHFSFFMFSLSKNCRVVRIMEQNIRWTQFAHEASSENASLGPNIEVQMTSECKKTTPGCLPGSQAAPGATWEPSWGALGALLAPPGALLAALGALLLGTGWLTSPQLQGAAQDQYAARPRPGADVIPQGPQGG